MPSTRLILWSIVLLSAVGLALSGLNARTPTEQTIVRNGFTVTATKLSSADLLKPQTDLMEELAREGQDDTSSITRRINILEEQIAAWRAIYDRSIYFRLTIGYSDGDRDIVYEKMKQGYSTYQEWLNTLLFSLEEELSIATTELADIPPSLYHLERTYGMSKDRALLVAFPAEFNGRQIKDRSMDLIVGEFGLETGRLVFEF